MQKWDLVIAHPPCTYLSNAGACRLYPKKGELDMSRYAEGLNGKLFFMAFYYYGYFGCGKICIENPVPSGVFNMPKRDQIIQPWQFGHPYTKKTCLWLFGLPPLMPTEIMEERRPYICGNSEIWKRQAAEGEVFGKEKDPKYRSRSFEGVARAMATQWG